MIGYLTDALMWIGAFTVARWLYRHRAFFVDWARALGREIRRWWDAR